MVKRRPGKEFHRQNLWFYIAIATENKIVSRMFRSVRQLATNALGIFLCLCSSHTKRAALCLALIFACMSMMFIPVFRNRLLYTMWPRSWQEMGTVDAITLVYFSPKHLDVGPVESCFSYTKPKVNVGDIDKTKIRVYDEEKLPALRHPEHYRFLSTMTLEDKVRTLHTYRVLEEALKAMRVEFFVVAGTLLGVHRHKGMIPWDDDFDIAVNVSDWKLVRHGLSCIEGYILSITNFMHWKFYPNSETPRLGYPFVDIFFYSGNDRYIWAIPESISLRQLFKKEDTFPLTTGQYEGLQVPIPKNTDHILRVQFDFNSCESPSMDHKKIIVYPKSQVSRVTCSSLSYLYQMYHIDE